MLMLSPFFAQRCAAHSNRVPLRLYSTLSVLTVKYESRDLYDGK